MRGGAPRGTALHRAAKQSKAKRIWGRMGFGRCEAGQGRATQSMAEQSKETMNLRPYQTEALDAILEQFQGGNDTLVVIPTGGGKTIVFAHLLDRRRSAGRGLVVAHREELIRQAVDKIGRCTDLACDVEMAGEYSYTGKLFERSDVVVTSVQTQNAGCSGAGRMSRFQPHQFGTAVIDEAHHATATSYRKLLDHYRANPDLRIVGVTATPDRHDEEALGQVFGTVAYAYEISDAIGDGWLVPIVQQSVHVEGLDFSDVRTTAGDLNGADLARIMEYEKTLHEIAGPALELAAGRKTLVFAASVPHAERLCEIFNRSLPDCARWVCGKTNKDERRQMFADYAAGRFQILCNVGVATEGFDEPGIEVVVMARPTKSRALYAQEVGRGTRPLTGLVDPHDAADARRAAIAGSGKPHMEVIDFVGNAGRHKLISAADILGGNYSQDVIERAILNAQSAGKPTDVTEELAKAEREIATKLEQERRRKIRATARYQTSKVSPFDVLDIRPWRERGWDKARPPSDKMKAFLEKSGVNLDGVTFAQARQLVGSIIKRRTDGRCTYKQAKLLQRYGYSGDSSFEEARGLIDAIKANGWQRPETRKAEVA